jgi:hypothetical protein
MVQFSRNGFFIHFAITIAICNEVSQKCLSVVTLEKETVMLNKELHPILLHTRRGYGTII